MERADSLTNLFEQVSTAGISTDELSAVQEINDQMRADGAEEALQPQSVMPVIRKAVGEENLIEYYRFMQQRLSTSSRDEMANEVIKAGGWEHHAKEVIEQRITDQFERMMENYKRAEEVARQGAEDTREMLLNGSKDQDALRAEAEAANERILKRLAEARKPSPETVMKIKQGLQAAKIDKAQMWLEQHRPLYNDAVRLASGVLAKSQRKDQITPEMRQEAKQFVDAQIQQGVYGSKLTQVIMRERTEWAKKVNLPKPTLEQVIPTSIKRQVAKIKAAERKEAGTDLHVAKNSLADNIARIAVAHVAIKNGAKDVLLRSDDKIKNAKVLEKVGHYAVLQNTDTGKNVIKLMIQKGGKALDIRKGDELRNNVVYRNDKPVQQRNIEAPAPKPKDDGKTR